MEVGLPYSFISFLEQHESSDDETPRTPRRTPMACQFCRGRKLKCDGLKPSCSNCNRRGVPCAYVPVPKS
ncbi:hypothetical protein BDW22DRAFT_1360208 [Trametopsis cervina]|nr:hypothetical protein BDW22DRAFT_1360208 [Trametopsis cervina]